MPLYGRGQIREENRGKTPIIGNYRFDYQGQPLDSPEYPWHERAFPKGPTEMPAIKTDGRREKFSMDSKSRYRRPSNGAPST
jgi:hypothetical protein